MEEQPGQPVEQVAATAIPAQRTNRVVGLGEAVAAETQEEQAAREAMEATTAEAEAEAAVA